MVAPVRPLRLMPFSLETSCRHDETGVSHVRPIGGYFIFVRGATLGGNCGVNATSKETNQKPCTHSPQWFDPSSLADGHR